MIITSFILNYSGMILVGHNVVYRVLFFCFVFSLKPEISRFIEDSTQNTIPALFWSQRVAAHFDFRGSSLADWKVQVSLAREDQRCPPDRSWRWRL